MTQRSLLPASSSSSTAAASCTPVLVERDGCHCFLVALQTKGSSETDLYVLPHWDVAARLYTDTRPTSLSSHARRLARQPLALFFFLNHRHDSTGKRGI